ncbi:MAG: DNA-3-methyladenine glycosylase 2 family protein [Calditrichaeota bacterium]|nr:DNA-3-methyladenine glycosylase 2 family protein [Calditrichota bacterium]
MEKQAIVNSTDIARLKSCDPIFVIIDDLYGKPPSWSRPPDFTSLSKIILGQQISLESAEAHFRKLNNYLPEFAPQSLIKLSDEEMRNCQISRQKTVYLRELSLAILEKRIDLDVLAQLSEKEMRAKLTSIKGIGNWTVDIYLMFCLQSKDIMPLGDIAIINAIKELSGKKTMTQIERLSKKWRPLRSLAAYFLWHYYLNKRGRNAEF